MGLVPARRPGWLLEGRGNPSPRGMAAHPPGLQIRAEDRTRLTGPLALLTIRCLANGGAAPYTSGTYGQAEEIGRLGFSALAVLR